ncbi:hypothetical protein JM93_00592 [Roseibium hamelinense]|uniref:Secreted protein n=1 Tax=Roseibium hamelinense TaxID=150831 RepID=A0A562THA3_9HYPH|nr:hypothetical protein [Roseibium hamelinense]TWI93039.1 hypothetical protein JM93_00592 [Roseibium hamelinense]
MIHLLKAGVFAISLVVSVVPAAGGEVEIVDAKASSSGGTWRFSVTLKHGDTGWDHYADLWQVIGPEGQVLGERILLHPHVEEQPFTRALSGVAIPDGISEVKIRARDSVHGFSDQEYTVRLD